MSLTRTFIDESRLDTIDALLAIATEARTLGRGDYAIAAVELAFEVAREELTHA